MSVMIIHTRSGVLGVTDYMSMSEAPQALRDRRQAAATSATRTIQDCDGFWKMKVGSGGLRTVPG
jgi:hypothetical protein